MTPNELFTHIWDIHYKKTGFDLDYFVEVDDNEKKIRLLFQPSSSVKDWVVNILGFVPLGVAPVYCGGWYTVFKNCQDLILNEVLDYKSLYPNYTIEVVGHSYGGAVSVIAGVEFFKVTGIKPNIITFGAPRPLFSFISKIEARLCLGEVIQYAHRSDIVTYCPPLPGYHNVKVKRVGKFSLKNLFDPNTYHMIYDDPTLY